MPSRDEQYLDALDRALDGGEPVDLLDPGTRRTISELQRLARTPVRRPRVASRTFVASPAIPRIALRRSRTDLSTNPRLAFAGTIALFTAIAMLAAMVALPGQRATDNTPLLAQASAEPIPECEPAEMNQPFPPTFARGSVITAPVFARPVGYLSPFSNLATVKESQLPGGDSPDEITANAVRNAVAARDQCKNTGQLGWYKLMVSDKANPLPNDAFLPSPSAETLQAFAIYSGGVATITGMFQINSVRVGVKFSPDMYGYGAGQFDVYQLIDGQWWLVDQAFYAPDRVIESTAPAVPPTDVQFSMWDDYLAPNVVTARADVPVQVRIYNYASAPYIFRIAELGVSVTIEPGQSATVEINAPGGVYLAEMIAPGAPTPFSARQLRLFPQPEEATPVS